MQFQEAIVQGACGLTVVSVPLRIRVIDTCSSSRPKNSSIRKRSLRSVKTPKQSSAFDRRSSSRGVARRRIRQRATHDIDEAVPADHVGECHGGKLLGNGQCARAPIAAVGLRDACTPGLADELDDSGKQGFAGCGGSHYWWPSPGKFVTPMQRRAVSHRTEPCATPRKFRCFFAAHTFNEIAGFI